MYGHTHVFIGFIHRVSRWGSFKGGHLNISIYRLFPPPWIIQKDCISGCQCCSSVPNTRKENWDFLVVHCIDLYLIPAPLFFFLMQHPDHQLSQIPEPLWFTSPERQRTSHQMFYFHPYSNNL